MDFPLSIDVEVTPELLKRSASYYNRSLCPLAMLFTEKFTVRGEPAPVIRAYVNQVDITVAGQQKTYYLKDAFRSRVYEDVRAGAIFRTIAKLEEN